MFVLTKSKVFGIENAIKLHSLHIKAKDRFKFYIIFTMF